MSGQRMYCSQDHPGSDEEADRWCESYHRPSVPLFDGWDRLRPTSQCRHCHGTGRAPGDGRTECGFCEMPGRDFDASEPTEDQCDRHGNYIAREGIDLCHCGSKYWEHDKCVDCGMWIMHLRDQGQ